MLVRRGNEIIKSWPCVSKAPGELLRTIITHEAWIALINLWPELLNPMSY